MKNGAYLQQYRVSLPQVGKVVAVGLTHFVGGKHNLCRVLSRSGESCDVWNTLFVSEQSVRERERGREGRREGGTEGRREGGREGEREGGREREGHAASVRGVMHI